MAKEEGKNTEEEKKEQEEQEVAPKKGLPIKLIVIIVLVLALLGGSFFALKGGILSFPKPSAIQSLEEGDATQDMGPIYSLDNFIVNLVGGHGKNYLKARLELEMDHLKTKEELDKRLPQIRDAILTMLSSKSDDDIKSLEGKFQLRAELISTLNQRLRTGKIVSIYFTEFIVQ